ncbi:MAG: permease [Rhodospirillales bacterium]|nr:permease [Rhodospirillales bacterium]
MTPTPSPALAAPEAEARPRFAELWKKSDPVLAACAAVVVALAVFVPDQAIASLAFTGRALGSIAPWFALSVFVAAAAKASGADGLMARVFVGREARMVVFAALFGALSPFCSCGVIPLIAGLLTVGVPLAPVMAFWIASPIMDPNMFALTAAAIGLEFAVVKALAAIGMGLFAGFATMGLVALGRLADPLRRSAPSACAVKSARKLLAPPVPVWRFWREPARAQTFVVDSAETGWFLARWMTVAFLAESLMLAYVPPDDIARWLGGETWFAIPGAVLLGLPAYLNGFAAIPLISGLIDLGMNPAVGMTFMVAGGVSSVPAMIAVWALVKPRVFAAYLLLAAVGALATGYGYLAYRAIG